MKLIQPSRKDRFLDFDTLCLGKSFSLTNVNKIAVRFKTICDYSTPPNGPPESIVQASCILKSPY